MIVGNFLHRSVRFDAICLQGSDARAATQRWPLAMIKPNRPATGIFDRYAGTP